MRSTERAARNFIRQRLGIDYDIVVVGSATGVIEDANIPGNVNVRIKASNGFMVPFSVGAPKNKISLQVGDAVELAYSRGKLRIVGIDPDGVLASGGNPIAKITDTDFNKQEDLATLGVTQTQTASTTVKVKAWNPIVNGTAYEFPGGEIDIATAGGGGSSLIPTSGNMARIVIFVKNDYLTLEAKTSTPRGLTDVNLNVADTNEAIALRTAGSTPVWAIDLFNAQTTITQNDIRGGRDLRNLVNNLDTYPSGALTVYDSLFTVQDNAAPTKQFQFQASGITAGQTRIYTVPDYNATLATLAGTETLTNKTLTDPIVNGTITQLSGSNWRPTADSTTALGVANAAGTNFVTYDTTNGTIGVGAAPTAFRRLNVDWTITNPAGVYAAARYGGTYTYTTNNSQQTNGQVNILNLTADSGVTASGNQFGLSNTVQILGTNAGTFSQIFPLYTDVTVAASAAGTITALTLDRVGMTIAGANTLALTTLVGLNIALPTSPNGMTTTSAFGIFVNDVTLATNNFAIATGAGNVRFGAAGATTAKLNVNAAASGVGVIVRANATTPGNIFESQNSSGTILSKIDSAGNVGVRMGSTSLTAYLHLAAGTTAASTAPIKLTSGTSMTAAEAGAIEYTTDDLFFTIATGTARKRILFADPTGGLTSGRVPFATTNGRLTDSADLTWGSSTLDIVGTLRADALRLDVSPTAETITPTHTITISVNGTNYKIPIVAA